MMQWSVPNLSPHTRKWQIDHQQNKSMPNWEIVSMCQVIFSLAIIFIISKNESRIIWPAFHCHHHRECKGGSFDRAFSWLAYCVFLLAVRIIIIPPSGVCRTSWFCLLGGDITIPSSKCWIWAGQAKPCHDGVMSMARSPQTDAVIIAAYMITTPCSVNWTLFTHIQKWRNIDLQALTPDSVITTSHSHL